MANKLASFEDLKSGKDLKKIDVRILHRTVVPQSIFEACRLKSHLSCTTCSRMSVTRQGALKRNRGNVVTVCLVSDFK